MVTSCSLVGHMMASLGILLCQIQPYLSAYPIESAQVQVQKMKCCLN